MKTFLKAEWQNLIMANYTVDPKILEKHLPKDIELDLFEGQAFVSLVGFMFAKTRLFGIPIPFFGSFEEVNLRFYVKRLVNGEYRRGVVFINETVPFAPVAWLANKLYREQYIAIPTRHQWAITEQEKDIAYSWKIQNRWNHLSVKAEAACLPMIEGSIEEFIFEHYYGYNKYSETVGQEYRVNHGRWPVHHIKDYEVDCDFEAMYGEDFAHLAQQPMHSIMLAEGSPVSIDWKRVKF